MTVTIRVHCSHAVWPIPSVKLPIDRIWYAVGLLRLIPNCLLVMTQDAAAPLELLIAPWPTINQTPYDNVIDANGVTVAVVMDVKSVVFVPVTVYPCWPLLGVVKFEPVHKTKWSFKVNVFALVCARLTFPFKLIFPVSVGST